MKEITFRNLSNEKLTLNYDSINVNDILMYGVKEIEIFQANEYSTHLIIKNEQNTIINRVFVGSTQRLLVNNDWKYIQVV